MIREYAYTSKYDSLFCFCSDDNTHRYMRRTQLPFRYLMPFKYSCTVLVALMKTASVT